MSIHFKSNDPKVCFDLVELYLTLVYNEYFYYGYVSWLNWLSYLQCGIVVLVFALCESLRTSSTCFLFSRWSTLSSRLLTLFAVFLQEHAEKIFDAWNGTKWTKLMRCSCKIPTTVTRLVVYGCPVVKKLSEESLWIVPLPMSPARPLLAVWLPQAASAR